MDHALEKTPAVRVHVVEIPAHTHHALRFLGPGIDLVRNRSIPNFLNYACRSVCGDFRGARPTGERYFTERSTIRKRENSEDEVLVLNRDPA